MAQQGTNTPAQTQSSASAPAASGGVASIVGRVRQQVEQNDVLAERIQLIRDAEAKREWAPISLGFVSGLLAGAVSYVNNLGYEVRDMIRHLRHTSSRKDKIGNQLLSELWKELEDHEKKITGIINPSEPRKVIGDKFKELYTRLGSIEHSSSDPVVTRARQTYIDVTRESSEAAKKVISELRDESHVVRDLMDAGKPVSDPEMRKKVVKLAQDIELAYEQGVAKITSARDDYRRVVENKVLEEISNAGRNFGFSDLTKAGKQRVILAAGTAAIAVGAMVYALVKFITRESAEDRKVRLALQATKEWELSQMQRDGIVIAKEDGLAPKTMRENKALEAAAFATAEKSHLQRQQERDAARASNGITGLGI
jgi:hypothetical protein